MSTPSAPGEEGPNSGLSEVVSERRQLTNIAYRLLGSLADAEDVVQETYARWYAMTRDQQQAIEAPGAWLTTVASRICLDLLGSARARRERYVGEWIPEPVPASGEWISGQGASAPADPARPARRLPGRILTWCEGLSRGAPCSCLCACGTSEAMSCIRLPPLYTFQTCIPKQIASSGRRLSSTSFKTSRSVSSLSGCTGPSFACGSRP